MGTWGPSAFENDTACDWAYELEEIDDLSVICRSLDDVVACGEDWLDSDVACEGLAACEVVALLIGRPDSNGQHNDVVVNWVEAHQSLDANHLIPQAKAVVTRILSPPSELLELWEEAGANDWRHSVMQLRSRLTD